MKNKILYSILGIALMIFATSCEDLLDKNPHDQISSGTFWKTQKDVDMALAGAYSRLNIKAYNFYRSQWDALAGNCYFAQTFDNIKDISRGQISATTSGLVKYTYRQLYYATSSCNIFLGNIDAVDMDESTKSIYKGEVLFLRAMHYYTLAELYGGVPLHIETATLENAITKQKTKAEVTIQVLKDLDDAIALLPDVSYTDGHAVKGTAIALKAKVLLGDEQWSEAATVANQIIQSGIFELYNNYPAMFIAAGQEDNKEIMFSYRLLNPDINYGTAGPEITHAFQNALNVFQEFVDAFECTDGLTISESPLFNPSNYEENRDPRLSYTIADNTKPLVRADGLEWMHDGNYTDYTVMKGIDVQYLPFDYSVRSDADNILLRYADVLLMYAEAKNEASGPDQSVYDAVNAVRSRPGIDMPDLPTGLSKAEMRERIRHERRVEFGLEGVRYFDLKRWKTMETVIPAVLDPAGTQWMFDPAKHYVWPMPQSAMDANPELEQNPGY